MELTLANLAPKKGARKKARRVGRGEGSGVGKTSGKGGKGQTARTGEKISPYFEGGQMPLYRRLPKLGFLSRKKILGTNRFRIVSLAELEVFDAGSEVTPEILAAHGISPRTGEGAGIKVLASGVLTKKLAVRVHAISESARQKIEELGGTVELLAK